MACARELAGRARTVVVDRRPMEGADHEATAISWDGAVLLTMGPAGLVEIAADALVIATGTRPLGRAELGLVGTRPAGVLSAPAACELAEQGRLRPARPAVIGGGDWAARAVAALVGVGAEHVTVVAPDGILTPLPPSRRITIHEGVRPLAVGGDPQVERLECDGAAFDCDAIVLAHGLAPVRNVDGAVSQGVRTVYAQPLRGSPHRGRSAAGRSGSCATQRSRSPAARLQLGHGGAHRVCRRAREGACGCRSGGQGPPPRRRGRRLLRLPVRDRVRHGMPRTAISRSTRTACASSSIRSASPISRDRSSTSRTGSWARDSASRTRTSSRPAAATRRSRRRPRSRARTRRSLTAAASGSRAERRSAGGVSSTRQGPGRPLQQPHRRSTATRRAAGGGAVRQARPGPVRRSSQTSASIRRTGRRAAGSSTPSCPRRGG